LRDHINDLFRELKTKQDVLDSIESRIDLATDELSELIADFDLTDDEWLKCRETIQTRIDDVQNILLYGMRG